MKVDGTQNLSTMETNQKQKRRAPNKIDYIVLHRPKQAAQLLDEFGYQSPTNPKQIAAAVKELIRLEGRQAITALLDIHPDRQAILKTEQEENYCYHCGSSQEQSEDNFCSVCNHDNFLSQQDKDDMLDQVKSMAKKELESFLDSLMKKANQDPEDTIVAEQTQIAWNELRSRPTEENKVGKEEEKPSCNCNKLTIKPVDGLLYLGASLLVGILIGSQLRRAGA